MNEKSEKLDISKRVKKKGSLKKRIFKAVIFLLYIIILAELASRIYWKVRRDVPFFSSQVDWYNRFYDELRESDVLEDSLAKNDDRFDVLLLGGSALDRLDHSLAEETTQMQDVISKATGREVKVYNLARPGMTTRDSLIKYRMLKDKHFDLVILYHGINDVRLNNCPSDKFRDDYTHSGWYHKIAVMESQLPMHKYFALPYTLEYCVIHILASKKLDNYVPRHRIQPEWTKYGKDVKTAKPFGDNIRQIADMASSRGEPLLVLTFGWYIPDDYSLEAFTANKLDYAKSSSPSAVELWGELDGVKAGLKKHNEVIRKLAVERPDIIFADAAVMIPQKGEYFNDVCHLSEKGKKELLKIAVSAADDVFVRAKAVTAKPADK